MTRGKPAVWPLRSEEKRLLHAWGQVVSCRDFEQGGREPSLGTCRWRWLVPWTSVSEDGRLWILDSRNCPVSGKCYGAGHVRLWEGLLREELRNVVEGREIWTPWLYSLGSTKGTFYTRYTYTVCIVIWNQCVGWTGGPSLPSYNCLSVFQHFGVINTTTTKTVVCGLFEFDHILPQGPVFRHRTWEENRKGRHNPEFLHQPFTSNLFTKSELFPQFYS